MSEGVTITIIVAMKREITPLLRMWWKMGVERTNVAGLDQYVSDNVRVVIAGIGRKSAAVAARVVIEYYEPELIVSAGLAGALTNASVGQVVCPAAVVDRNTGERYETVRDPRASGVLVTAASVSSQEEKKELAEKYGAEAVDMEAAVVAEVAHASGVPFVAVKAISDALDFEMPPMDRFISNGRLDLLKLLGYAALRPRTWKALKELRRNSKIAAEALARELEKIVNPHIAH
jgi:adenosylhomocysteine nucleosidase